MRQEYGSPKTLYNRFKRWSDRGIFEKMLKGMPAVREEIMKCNESDEGRRKPAKKKGKRKRKNITVMMDSVFCKAHRTSCSMALRVGKDGRQIGLKKGGQNSKLHVVCDDFCRPIDIYLTAGNVSDYNGARVRKNRKNPVPYNKKLYERRHKIENCFARYAGFH